MSGGRLIYCLLSMMLLLVMALLSEQYWQHWCIAACAEEVVLRPSLDNALLCNVIFTAGMMLLLSAGGVPPIGCCCGCSSSPPLPFMQVPDESSLTPSAVLSVDLPTLRACGLSERKASYLHDLAAHFQENRLSDDLLLADSEWQQGRAAEPHLDQLQLSPAVGGTLSRTAALSMDCCFWLR